MSTVTVVTLTRRRHPFEGRPLPVLGSMLRHGAMELLVVLPDGSKRLIPAAWTDLEPAPGGDGSDGPGTLGSAADLLGLSVLVSGLPRAAPIAGSRLHGSHRARRTTVPPVQLSLLPDQVPAPPPALTGHLPAVQIEAALVLLARLIVKAAAAAAGAEDGDE